MNKKQANDLIVNMLKNCPALNSSTIKVMSSESSDVVSKGHQVHIKPIPNEESLCCLRSIAEKQNIAIRQEEERLILYKPLNS